MKNLIKISSFSGLAVLIKIITSLISMKVIALFTGPVGVAMLGQFATLCSIFSAIAGGGISYGIVKFIAELRHSSKHLYQFINSASSYTLICTLITMVIGVAFSKPLSYWVIGSYEYRNLIIVVSLAQFFIAYNLLLCSVFNGLQQVRKPFFASVSGSMLGLVILVNATTAWGLPGAMFGMIIAQVTPLITCLFAAYNEPWYREIFRFKLNKANILDLSRYSVMNIVSTLTVPIAFVLVRNDLSSLYGWQTVGYWQAVTRVSDAYLIFATSTLTSYYLPRLSYVTDPSRIWAEIVQAYTFFIPIVGLVLVGLYAFRDVIILLLYTPEFASARDLFLFQLVGDFFRVGGWVFTYLLLAKTRTKTFIATELALSLMFVVLSYKMCRIWGVIGVTYAFALAYGLYWLLMVSIASLFLRERKAIYVTQ